MDIGFGEKELIISASILLGSCMFLKICFLYINMWKRGTERKTVLSFLVFELFVVVYLWLPYEKSEMSNSALLFQRVITAGVWLGILLLGVWWLVFRGEW